MKRKGKEADCVCVSVCVKSLSTEIFRNREKERGRKDREWEGREEEGAQEGKKERKGEEGRSKKRERESLIERKGVEVRGRFIPS